MRRVGSGIGARAVKCFRPQCGDEAVRVVLLRERQHDGGFAALQYCQQCYGKMTELWSHPGWRMPEGIRALQWEDLPPDTLSVMEVDRS